MSTKDTTSMHIGPLKFWWVQNQHTPWRESRSWVVNGQEKSERIENWDIVLDEPARDVTSLEISDLKRWFMLSHAGKATEAGSARTLSLGLDRAGHPTFRKVPPKDALVRYVTSVLKDSGVNTQTHPVAFLFPALNDAVAPGLRRHLLDAIEEAVPNAAVYSEPEMTVEYFRLVKRRLVLDSEQNTIVLVIDVGASTANITAITSNRDDSVVGGTASRQRARRLRAVQGTAQFTGGRWIDEVIAKHAKLTPPSNEAMATSFWREIEEAKIKCSRTGATIAVAQGTISREDLRAAAWELAGQLESSLQEVGQQLWDQNVGTEIAKDLSAKLRAERKADEPKDALRMVSTVILAGGSSLLPEFREAMETLLPGGVSYEFLPVGEDYAIAAATGTLAHVLSRTSPPGIRTGDEEVDQPGIPTLEGGLPFDVQFAWKQQTGSEERLTLLKRGDPSYYSLRHWASIATIPIRAGKFEGRLVRSGPAKSANRGQQFKKLETSRANPALDLLIDEHHRAKVESDDISRLSEVILDLTRDPSSNSWVPEAAPVLTRSGHISMVAAPFVIFDLGMSKTVLVSSTGGGLDPIALETLTAYSASQTGASSARTRATVRLPRTPGTTPTSPAQAGTTVLPESPSPVPPPRQEPDPGQTPSREAADPQPEHLSTPATTPVIPPAELLTDARSKVVPTAVSVSPAAKETPHTTRDQGVGWARSERIAPEAFGEELLRVREEGEKLKLDIRFDDLLFALMAIAVRPLVLLAGPPGCGKSTLVRIAAHLLGKRHAEQSFWEIPVEAHWEKHLDLVEEARLESLINPDRPQTLLLFDEFNLARPERYLARHLHHLDTTHEPRWRAFATLNIDETSRPPAPKVLDRAMLLELEPPPELTGNLNRLGSYLSLPRLSGLPWVPENQEKPDKFIEELLKTIFEAVRKDGLRADLLPSHRALQDISDLRSLHAALPDDVKKVLPRENLEDRLLTGRLLHRLAGPGEQVKPIIDALRKAIKGHDKLPLVEKRLKLAELQLSMGYVSPWQ